MTKLSRVHLATKQLTEPRSDAPLAVQYVKFKREALAQQDRLYIRAAVNAVNIASPEIPDPEPEAAQRSLLE
jgi:hypothetical protein